MKALAAGTAIAAAITWGFVPTVIRIYASGGSLAGAVDPGAVAVASLLANVTVFTLAAVALRRRTRRQGRSGE